MQMLSLARANNHGSSPPPMPNADAARQRIQELSESRLRGLVETAIRDHVGVMTHSESGEDSLDRDGWRRELEQSKVGTVGVPVEVVAVFLLEFT